jgi:hypothetical protein
MNLEKPGPGRPRKYGRSSRPVTMTLPDDVIARLSAIDNDLGRAIVAVVERGRTVVRRPTSQPAELASYGNRAVIVVTPLKALTRLEGVQLVPIGNGRALISLDHPHSIPQLELAIGDALEREGPRTPERRTLETIADILRRARRSRGTTVEERTIIVLGSPRRRSQAAPRPTPGG